MTHAISTLSKHGSLCLNMLARWLLDLLGYISYSILSSLKSSVLVRKSKFRSNNSHYLLPLHLSPPNSPILKTSNLPPQPKRHHHTRAQQKTTPSINRTEISQADGGAVPRTRGRNQQRWERRLKAMVEGREIAVEMGTIDLGQDGWRK